MIPRLLLFLLSNLFLLFSFCVLYFLVVVPCGRLSLTHVGFRAHVKIASRIVSYRIVSYDHNHGRLRFQMATKHNIRDSNSDNLCTSFKGAIAVSAQ